MQAPLTLSSKTTTAALPVYSGPWTAKEASFLLKRTTYGPSPATIEAAVNQGFTATINQLFTVDPLPDPPVKQVPDNASGVLDPEVTQGQTWINADPFPNTGDSMLNNQIRRYRRESMFSWWLSLMFNEGISIREKMVTFWHNHFVVSDFLYGERMYDYINTLRTHALGNFKQLTKDMTINTGMLLYLNGAENTNTAPNENYARELLELFTIGKGPLAGPGDYTTFTEDDVVTMAKVLTGWITANSPLYNILTPFFINGNHTPGPKTLSPRFNDAVILENGPLEYSDLIDEIFVQDECSRFITRKLYRWFVGQDIDATIESTVIEPIAQTIRDNNYDISQGLKELIQSQHFFDKTACMIKNPLDLILSGSKGLGVSLPNNLENQYNFAMAIGLMCNELGMGLFQHPNVAGWKAYYQEPKYYREWLNSVTYPLRNTYMLAALNGGPIGIAGVPGSIPALVDAIDFIADIPNNTDANDLIYGIAEKIFPYAITSGQKDYLKDILIPGLPDFEWTVEYSTYLSDPTDIELRLSIDAKLKAVLSAMIQMPEFQLM